MQLLPRLMSRMRLRADAIINDDVTTGVADTLTDTAFTDVIAADKAVDDDTVADNANAVTDGIGTAAENAPAAPDEAAAEYTDETVISEVEVVDGQLNIETDTTAAVDEVDSQDELVSEPDLPDESEELLAPVDEMTENLWNDPNVPHSGWICAGITDLGSPSGICQMCGHQIIRYVHQMIHPHYRSLGVGCICAGRMEGDVNRAKKRERDFKNRAARLESFRKRTWKNSRKGNPYLRINHRVVVLYQNKAASILELRD